tara:strand:+ start:496 stop:1542 length:1047 start_codon:yes stop_codon:yes gene_type:complete
MKFEKNTTRILVTGGSGFIGSNFIIQQLLKTTNQILNLDKLTYAASINSLENIKNNSRYKFVKGDICDNILIKDILENFKPTYIVNFAAESHVDNSIKMPDEFINTNILGVFNLLKNSRDYISTLKKEEKEQFKFLHISTDEVYGSLELEDPSFTEESPYRPSSPYSASKASSDHLVFSWFKTYNFPAIITNCSNNYGPFQFPEKLIPLVIISCLNEKKIPLYGDGMNIRDWIYVEDHCNAIDQILIKGKIGNRYNIGSDNQLKNIDIIKIICNIMDDRVKRKNNLRYLDLLEFVKDRPGHDFRYAIDNTKIKEHIGWNPSISFEEGILRTIDWYLDNQDWFINKNKQ